MNLYEIMMEHYAPKDSERGIYTYLAADSDEEVYEWLKSEEELKDGRQIFLSWKDEEKDDDSFKDRIIGLNGDLNDDEVELTDLYYGETLIGWKLIKENITNEEIEVLKSVGICLETI
jgi:hypothetical protein